MSNLLLFPIFLPLIGGLLLITYKEEWNKCRDYSSFVIVIAEFVLSVMLFYLPDHHVEIPYICGLGLHFMLDGFRKIYLIIASFMWMMTIFLSKEYQSHHHHKKRFMIFMLLTLGATVGVFLSADLYTTFIFFEMMSFTSYVWVAQEETEGALKAASTYLAVAVIGGLTMLMGIFLLYHELGTLEISLLKDAVTMCPNKGTVFISGLLMLFGFGAKAGSFPLHIWLPKAHPVAPAPASALLSGILTKTGIYGILLLTANLLFDYYTWGLLILILGTVTMFTGALLAVFSIDLKHTLACSSMSQIGFIMIGCSMQNLLPENGLALSGTVLHMINHSLIKLVLFMAAGVIYMNAHSLDLNDLRGFGHKKPILAVSFLIGALSISGIPGFSGYISKTLLHEAIVEYGKNPFITTIEWIFLISGGMTFAYMSKLFVAIFLEKNNDIAKQNAYDCQKKYMSPISTFALFGSAIVLFIWGLFPKKLMMNASKLSCDFLSLKGELHNPSFFHFDCLKGGLISITIGLLLYFFFIRKIILSTSVSNVEKDNKKQLSVYRKLWPSWLDLENLIYRPLLLNVLPTICLVIFRTLDSFVDVIVLLLRKSIFKNSPLPVRPRIGTSFTNRMGKLAIMIKIQWNRIFKKNTPVKDYIYLFAQNRLAFIEQNMIIKRSLSYGLLMFCIGFVLTIVYLLIIYL